MISTYWKLAGLFFVGGLAARAADPPLTVYLAPNTHGTVSGWLVDFDTERSHVVNNYAAHMDRVDADPAYAMAYSEVPNLMVLMQFAPERLAQLKRQLREGRTELVNGFFLEPTINLSGGEALAQMGTLGLRWYDEVFGVRPRFSWMIDVCGTHRQMPQIVCGLGLEALFFSRNNPSDKSAFWWAAPDGSRTLAICLGRGYSSTSKIFKTADPLNATEMDALYKFIAEERQASPSTRSVFAGVGGGDYSLAPKRASYPGELVTAWQQRYPDVRLRFAVPGDYVDALKAEIRAGQITLAEYSGDTAHSYNAFWMNMPEVKLAYRRSEHALQAAEQLSTAASLTAGAAYPSEPLYNSWLLMLMNMDRNILWGAGAGEPFYGPGHWNANDRFEYVNRHAGSVLDSSLASLTRPGNGVALYNPLNWRREDPIELPMPAGKRPVGLACEARAEEVLCAVPQPASGISSIRLQAGATPKAVEAPFEETVETAYYTLKLDRRTGAIVSLRDKAGREYLGGPANVVLAESVAGIVKDPANYMVARPLRKIVDTSSSHESRWRLLRGPLTTTLVAKSGFVGESTLERRITLYATSPRIDFETTVDLRSPDTLVTVDFPLAGTVVERTRGIPYGFATVDPRHVAAPTGYFLGGDHRLYGFSDAISPAVRWSDYGVAGGGGLALLDRGLTCHELNGNTVTLALLNAQSHYRKLANTVLAGQGRHTFAYALWPHSGSWQQARIPQRAWEFNTPVLAQAGRLAAKETSFLATSPNMIVEAVRRIGPDIELRMVEWTGTAGEAEVTLRLPHSNARITNLMGEQGHALVASSGAYRFPVKPQQIVTLRFAAPAAVAVPPAIRAWDALIPPAKRGAYRQHLDAKGYPGGEPKW
jgi:alpha-mannosidase